MVASNRKMRNAEKNRRKAQRKKGNKKRPVEPADGGVRTLIRAIRHFTMLRGCVKLHAFIATVSKTLNYNVCKLIIYLKFTIYRQNVLFCFL